jgi:uncharacterized protein (TIRG00374 family)
MTSLRLFPRRRWAQAALAVPALVGVGALVWWRGPEWSLVYHAFDFVIWGWIAAAIGLNFVSVVLRAVSWRLTIGQALPPPQPRFASVFSAFAVGLLANAVLPGRIGELARVAVLRRHLDHGRGTSATLVGTVFAHRLFDLVPAILLVLYVFGTARIPHWAVTSLLTVLVVGALLFTVAASLARRQHRQVFDELDPLRQLLAMARRGFSVMRSPGAAAGAICFQIAGWTVQLLAVWVAMRAFDIHAPLPAAGLVLLLMNVATVFPLWPGNIGLLQAAVALPLVQYGVAYPTGFAYGLVLQVLEMCVGVGVGLIFLAREGLSFAMLRGMPATAAADVDAEPPPEAARARARVSG